jgi:hypothetical protein
MECHNKPRARGVRWCGSFRDDDEREGSAYLALKLKGQVLIVNPLNGKIVDMFPET